MFRTQRNEEKIDFKFSNFQALQVPKIWDNLLVSTISVETGKTIAKSNKALVRNGNCYWSETLSESIWISHYDSSKELEEHLFKFVVSMGSAKSDILGEATVNIASYYTCSRSISPVSLPLKKCEYGTILQVILMWQMQSCMPNEPQINRFNTEAVDENYDAGSNRSNGSTTILNLSAKFPSIQNLGPNSLVENFKNMERSYGASAECSFKKEILYPKSLINGIKQNIYSNCRNNFLQSSCPFEEQVYVSKSNNSSFKSRITHNEQEQECNRSSPPVPSTSSMMNVNSSKNLPEAAEDAIEELLEQAFENKRISNNQTCLDLEKEYKTTLSVEEENVDNLESKLSERKEIEKDQMREIQLLKMEVSEEKKERQESMEISLNESNITSTCLDNLRNDLIMLSSSLDSQVSTNKSLEQKVMKLEKVKGEMELNLFKMEEENIKLLDHVAKLESQLNRVKDEHEITRLELEDSESAKSELQNEVKNLQNVEKLLLNAQEECEYVKSEKKKLQESAENLIEECNTLQKSYEDMTKGNAELYDQYSCLVIELRSETEKFQKEVKHLKEEVSRIDEQKSTLNSGISNLESSLTEVHLKTEMTENEIQTVREVSELKIQDLTTELAAIKQNYKKLMTNHKKNSKLLTVSEQERQQLIEEAANLKDVVLDYKQKIGKLKNEKCNLEAALHSVSKGFEELKAEKMSFFNKMSEFEDCKIQRNALEVKLSRLEGDLKAKNASHLHDADLKNKIRRIKSANLQYQLKIQQLEGEKKECLKKIEDLQLLSASTKTGVHETCSQEDTNYAAKIKMLRAELNEALDANNKYKVQLQKLKSEGCHSLSSVHGKSKVEGKMVKKEQIERTKSSLETELKDRPLP
ncbi:hypothetical protein E3N88_16213 [Mikania micrantha]|uniref:C2 NT-type domain-containing protein n=1 Tax=Mikania micrantha TaxID=192012 RepID=A0A5N6NZW8_9ASTR|nr:hypothetical protein E3N88_16213 [Mikania micrantha]